MFRACYIWNSSCLLQFFFRFLFLFFLKRVEIDFTTGLQTFWGILHVISVG